MTTLVEDILRLVGNPNAKSGDTPVIDAMVVSDILSALDSLGYDLIKRRTAQ